MRREEQYSAEVASFAFSSKFRKKRGLKWQ
jgi:hypothetical protein